MPTAFVSHKKHFEMGRENTECRIPVLFDRYILKKNGEKKEIITFDIEDYDSFIDYRRSTLGFDYTLKGVAKISVRRYFSLVNRYMMHTDITVEPLTDGITLTFECEVYDNSDGKTPNDVTAVFPVTREEYNGRPVLVSNTTRGAAYMTLVSPTAEPRDGDARTLALDFDCAKTATHSISTVLVSHRDTTDYGSVIDGVIATSDEDAYSAHVAAWERFWLDTATTVTGYDIFDKFIIRCAYTLRCSADNVAGDVPLQPMGLSSSRTWAFCFPQDYLWMYESYLGTNRLDLAAATADYWLENLDQAIAYTKKYFNTKGAFWPWQTSTYDYSPLLSPETYGPYGYQLHNAAYPLRMVHLYWKFSNDSSYLERALPLVYQVAEFYQGISTLTDSGKYEIHFTPCLGQDEFGGFNRKNYFCCMTSAIWTIHAAIEMYRAAGKEPEASWLDIEGRGYNVDLLVTDDGFLATYEGGPGTNPKQKHPVQLNAIVTLPVAEFYGREEFKNVYRLREKISIHSEYNYWTGWSLGTMLVASARMRDAAGFSHDLRMLLENPYSNRPQIDKKFLQAIESGGITTLNIRYFHTVMALFVTATTELFSQYYDGKCTLLPTIITSTRMAFDNVLTPFGFTVSGEVENGCAELSLSVTDSREVHLALGDGLLGDYAIYNQNGMPIAFVSQQAHQPICLPVGEYVIRQIGHT